MTIYYFDPINGNDANDGLSFATRVKTIQTGLPSSRIAAGDTGRGIQSPNPTSMGQNITATFQSPTLTLASPVTIDVDMCETAWTVVAANITGTTNNTVYKQGTNSVSFQTTAIVGASLISYKTLGGATDFSSMQQLSYWLRTSSAVAANSIQIALCSDTVGAVPVNTFTVNFTTQALTWHPVVIDSGGALNASIRSVALYFLANVASGTAVLIDSIFTSKASSAADSLTLASQIGRNSTTEPWNAIASISGSTVILDQGPNSIPTAFRGYGGTSGVFSDFVKRECLRVTSATNVVQRAGTDSAPILYSFGWDSTNMSTQVGESWYDFSLCSAASVGFNNSGLSSVQVEKLTVVRSSSTAFNSTGTLNVSYFKNCRAISVGGTGFSIAAPSGASVFDTNMVSNNLGTGFSMTGQGWNNIVRNMAAFSCTGIGFNISGRDFINGTPIAKNCSSSGFQMTAAASRVYNLTTAGNATQGVVTAFDTHYINANISDATAISARTAFAGQYVYFQDYQNVIGNHVILTDGGQITADITNRHTPSGICWKFSPTSATRGSFYPIQLMMGHQACRANKLVTIQCWIYLDNAAISAGLLIKGGRYPGITNDVQVLASSGTIGSYQQITLNLTPTAQTVIEVYAIAFGGTTANAYFDDLSFLQAS